MNYQTGAKKVASQPENNRAEEIRRTMHEIRRELDDDVYHISSLLQNLLTGNIISGIIPGSASALLLLLVFLSSPGS